MKIKIRNLMIYDVMVKQVWLCNMNKIMLKKGI